MRYIEKVYIFINFGMYLSAWNQHHYKDEHIPSPPKIPGAHVMSLPPHQAPFGLLYQYKSVAFLEFTWIELYSI